RRCNGTYGSARQVSLVSQEHIEVVAKLLGFQSIDPALLRRNLVVSGININALRHQQFEIGEAVFEATALCHPCSRMDEALGQGGHAAMLGHGGICAKVIRSGVIRLGDPVIKIDKPFL
nr:MOSC domain-containing protein [Acidiferrobacterales bacterium]